MDYQRRPVTRDVVVAIAAWLATATAIAPALAGDPATLAGSCSGCHTASPTLATTIPRIAGQKADAIVEAMAAFAGGTRPATVMDRIAKGFTSDEIRAIATAIADQK